MEERTRRRRLVARWARPARAVAVLVVALLIVVAARPAPIASGPRPPKPASGGVADATTAPLPHVDGRFATLPYVDEVGRPGTWVLAASAKPLQMVVEREVADRFGLDELGRALEVWNDTPGSDFAVNLAGISDDRLDAKRRDGVNRVFLDRQTCGERFLARAHLFPAEVRAEDGRSVAWVTEVDVGVCDRLSRDLLAPVMRHELAHVAGVGHLCEPDEECWTPAMGQDNRCRIMATAAYPCQVPDVADDEALAHLHPRLPRITAHGAVGTAAATSRVLFPRAGTHERIIVTHAAAPADLQAAAAVLAGTTGVPHLLVDDDCVRGRDGTELNRLAAIDATVVLVGDVPGGCEDDLRLGWALEVERLGDVTTVTAAVADAVGGAPTRVVVTAPAGGAPLPTVALAAPVAVGLGAPLVTATRDELERTVTDLVRDLPTVRGVVVIGTARELPAVDVAQLEAATGVRVRHLTAPDGLDLALKLARMRDVFATGDELRAVLVAGNARDDAAAAAALAAATGSVVLPVFPGPASPDVRLGEFLDERVAGGYVMGSPSEIGTGLQIRLSRAVDGAR